MKHSNLGLHYLRAVLIACVEIRGCGGVASLGRVRRLEKHICVLGLWEL